MIDIEGEQFDSEAILQFTLLKKVLLRFSGQIKFINDKIDNLQRQNDIKDKRINELESKLQTTINNSEKRFKGIEITLSKITTNLQKKKTDPNEKSGGGEMVNYDDIKQQVEKQFEEEKKIEEQKAEQRRIEEKEREMKILEEQKKLEEEKKKILEEQEKLRQLQQAQLAQQTQQAQLAQQTQQAQSSNDGSQKFIPAEKKQLTKVVTDENGDQIQISSQGKESTELLGILYKRVAKAEKRIEELQRQLHSYSKIPREVEDNTGNIKKTDEAVNELRNDLDEFKMQYEENNKLLDDVKVKLADFSIYDIFKDNGDGNLDIAKTLIINLENKVFMKFGMVDERMKIFNEDVVKMKSEVKNMNTVCDGVNRSNQRQKELVTQMEKDINEFKQKVEEEIAEIDDKFTKFLTENKLDFNMDDIKKLIKEERELLEEKINDKIKEVNADKKIEELKENNPGLSEGDLELIQDINKRLIDLERMCKKNFSIINIDKINERLKNNEDAIVKKLEREDLTDLYDKIRGHDKVNKEHSFQIEELISRAEKNTSDLSQLITKMEHVTAQCASIQNFSNENTSSTKGPLLDMSKFIEQGKFQENNKALRKLIDEIKLEEEDLRRILEDISNKINKMPSEEDFKGYQDNVVLMFEENRNQNKKRFADKIDTNKAIRLIETKIKELMDGNKRENSENWLIAKKPMSGFQCASCESELRELSQKNEYVAWNKYPNRDEKQYRMGHGFSRMLQMVNLDILKNAELVHATNNDVSDEDETKIRPLSGSGKKRKLPLIQINRTKKKKPSEVLRTENDIEAYIQTGEDLADPYEGSADDREGQPKVVKIIKKKKNLNLSKEKMEQMDNVISPEEK